MPRKVVWTIPVAVLVACGGELSSGGSAPDAGGDARVTSSGSGVPDAASSDGAGTDACVPITCASVGSECGHFDDGCGGVASCGTCAGSMVCMIRAGVLDGGGPGRCEDVPPDPCTHDAGGGCCPIGCADRRATCGIVGDGCGGVLHCGTCDAGTCGGGVPNQCGP